MTELTVISADSHVSEPRELVERLPPELRARAPRVEERETGTYYIQEGQLPVRLDIAASNLTEEDKRREFRNEDDVAVGKEAGVDIPLRLADLEEDGVSAEVIYPQAIFKTFTSPDPQYQMAFARTCNDWYIETFGPYRDKFVVSSVIPMLDIPGATEEAERVARLGCRSLSLPVSMPALPYNRPDYEPFWSAVEELGVPLAFHVFSRGGNQVPEDRGEADSHGADMLYIALGMAEAMSPLAMLIASGVLQRHPNLKFVLVRQGYVTFGDDEVGLRNRDITGVDCLMWGSDYPHDEGTFPHSREVIARTFKDTPDEETRKIVGGNAAALYGFGLG